jgi:hypothetical protein
MVGRKVTIARARSGIEENNSLNPICLQPSQEVVLVGLEYVNSC